MTPLGTWWAAVPRDRWPDHDGARAYVANHWQEPWGDRRQEIVFIGAGIDWSALKGLDRLDAALVPEHLAILMWPMPGPISTIPSRPLAAAEAAA